ncbi:transmembrane reductase CYB561D2-like [Chironomus tepperi]|uniref:transmembrane reductase CYB561D2-like n=1 Tax=Chironomus tepperi TaxID=113505 RepID=UPI00391F1493
MLTMDIDSKKSSIWDKCEIFINTANHCLIAITTFYLMWYCLHNYGMTHTLTLHAWTTAIGYQVLMAEGIMAFYKANSLTSLSSKREKNHIHWILQVIGGSLALYGIIIEIIDKDRRNLAHFISLHAIYGLVSMVCLCFTILSGLSALFSYEVRRYLKPVISKFSHNTLALVTFITGMISLIYGWTDTRWARLYDPGNLRYMSSWSLGFIIAFTCIGAFKSWIYQLIGVEKLLLRKSEKETVKDSEKQ